MLVDELRKLGKQLLKPRQGYDLSAPYYELWHWFQFWRLNEAPIIKRWLESLKLGVGLDAGSGTGTYICDITELGHRCVAIDLSWQMLSLNRKKTNDHICNSPVLYVQGNIEALPFKANQVDWILCSRVLSHVPHITYVLREFSRVLKKHGECLISDIHPAHPYTHVAILINDRKIAIETHKHSIGHFKEAVSNVQDFQLVSLDEYYLEDLHWKPPRRNFDKLYRHSNTAVFYVSRLIKTS